MYADKRKEINAAGKHRKSNNWDIDSDYMSYRHPHREDLPSRLGILPTTRESTPEYSKSRR